jgi:hypothetical protein
MHQGRESRPTFFRPEVYLYVLKEYYVLASEQRSEPCTYSFR